MRLIRILSSLQRLTLLPTTTSVSNFFCKTREFSTSKFIRPPKILALNNLENLPGAKKKRRRWGRGTGSGRGKLCGRGHQQRGRTPRGFEGGQTPLYKTIPKVGFNNINHKDLQVVNIDHIQEFIQMGRLKPEPGKLVTVRDFVECGLISNAKDGVKLLARAKTKLTTPIHLEVSFASERAIERVEKAGGTVTCVHFNKLALRALIKPFKFNILPRRARPPPKIMDYYLDHTKAGYLSPEIQIRNLKLFGSVTSEESLREEHEKFMIYQRQQKQATSN